MNEPQLELTVPIEVRFADLDIFGHVNNATFLAYLENARVAHYREFFGKPRPEDFKAVVARIEIDYAAPVWLDSEIVCHIGITELGRSSLTFEYKICTPDASMVYARAKSVHVMFDKQSQRSFPIPEEFRRAIVHARAARGLPPPKEKAAK